MCPARVACLVGGDAAALLPYRPVRVFVAPGDGGAYGVTVEEHAGLACPGDVPRGSWLRDGDLDAPSGDGVSGRQVLDRFADALTDIAERNRGYTVAVVSGAVELPLAALCTGLTPARVYAAPLRPGDVALVEYDADGWRYVSGWPA